MKTKRSGLESCWIEISVLLICVCVVSGPAATAEEAEPLGVGDSVEWIELEDQFGESQRVDKTTRLILFSRDREGDDLLNTALGEKSREYLSDRGVVYVADISLMPGLVARLFALPKMRKRLYPMLLDRKGEATKRLPSQKDYGTLIELDELRILEIQFLSDVDEIGLRLERQHRSEVSTP